MRKITLDESKKIQLDILQNVHDFCNENNLRYSMAGGTLIGAVRHKGFIPWDDDIDIVMPRNEFDRFVSLYVDSQEKYKVHYLSNDRDYCYPYAKIEDTRTLLDENVAGPKMGISIDVFPMDDMDDGKEKCIKFVKTMMVYKNLYKAKLITPSRRNSFLKIVGVYALKTLLCIFSLRRLAVILSKRAMKFKDKKSAYIGCVVAGYGLREIFPRSIFDNLIDLPFEDKCFRAFADYDVYLKSLYGDYMQLPPEEKRVSPHTLNGIFWKDK